MTDISISPTTSPTPTISPSFPVSDVLSNQHGIRLDVIHLQKIVIGNPSTQTILHPLSFSILPGELVAISGHSGSGKSTLLQLLQAHISGEGQVFWEGYPLAQVYAYYRRQIGYIPQQDTLHKILTVYQALWYAARLRLPIHTPKSEIEERIQYALEVVELINLRDIHHKQIFSLSNGEQLRVRIAAELLTSPRILFLDEPTSGLDPLVAKRIMQSLRRVADLGYTIILNTHNTHDLHFCDLVLFLSDGYLTYVGRPNEALTFFQAQDFAAIYQQVDQRGKYWNSQFHAPWVQPYQEFVVKRLENRPLEPTKPIEQIPPITGEEQLYHCKYLWQRLFALIRHDRLALTILLFVMPFIGILLIALSKPNDLIGFSEIQDGETYIPWRTAEVRLVIMALAAIFLGTFASIHEILRERSIFLHEAKIGISAAPYLVSKLIVFATFALLQCFSFLVIIALHIHLPKEGTFMPASVELFITLFFTVMASVSLGLFISALSNSMSTTMYITMIILFIQIIFSGAIFNLEGLSESLSYLTISRWSLNGLGITADMETLGRQTQICLLSRCERFPTPLQAMAVDYGYSFGDLVNTWLVLVGFTTFFLLCTYFVLRHQIPRPSLLHIDIPENEKLMIK